MLKYFYLLLTLAMPYCVFSQFQPTSATRVTESLQRKKAMEDASLLKHLPAVNIGPTIMSGRVSDLEVNPSDPTEFYVGYASGGLWHTSNNGTSFSPLMDDAPTQNIGDIAVDWASGTIWAGTGENNSSRSSYAGIGILRSLDKGKTWENMGLHDSHHIGGILINPDNPDEVVVGALGHLYSTNEERGIYKTTDGGKTWKNTLFVDNATGVIELVTVPGQFDQLFAATWQKDRKGWNFDGSGSGSAIYRSRDGGDTWENITMDNNGFPVGEGIGRIGLAVFDANTVYALLDNQNRRDPEKEITKKAELDKDDFVKMSAEEFLKLENSELNDFLKKNGFQEKYRAENVKQMVRSKTVLPRDLAHYLEDANSLLFETPVIGAEVYRSNDGGTTWTKMNLNYIDDLYYSYGYYFGEIRVDASDKNKIYICGVPLLKSADGGKEFTALASENVHADHQALWVNPSRPGHLINGNDGGLNMSYDDGAHWTKLNSVSVAQFYAIAVDQQEPYNVYGGLQDNGVWMGPHNAGQDSKWHASGHHPWKSILGGDGMQVQVDKRNADIVYTGFQFGNYYRLDLDKDSSTYIQPRHDLGQSPYRFNWQTPILLSPHNQDILYMGSNVLHRSMNMGDDWEVLSEDLTKGGVKGNVSYGTLTTLSESPLKFGLLYTGSDDGLIHLSRDGGGRWEEVGQHLPLPSSNKAQATPGGLWVSRVVASAHKKERVYATLNGYRWDDFNPYIFMSDDFGSSWTDLAATLPASAVNVLLEDPLNENLLYAGTDNGLYVSLTRGQSWEVFQNGVPNVAIHDLAVQQKEGHLVIGTHGRGIYTATISPLQSLNTEIMARDLYLFKPEKIEHSADWGTAVDSWEKPETPGLDIVFYTKAAASYEVQVKTVDGIIVSATEVVADAGVNIVSFDLAFSKGGKIAYLKKNKKELPEAKDGKTYLPEGAYVFEISGKGTRESVAFDISPSADQE